MVKRELIRAIICVPLIFILPIMWISQLIIVIPFLILALLSQKPRIKQHDGLSPIYTKHHTKHWSYNRVDDISKIYGCNTRNVKYRWDIFIRALKLIKTRERPGHTLTALDFGAGSLRDTYELARLGFAVEAIDLNYKALLDFTQCYDWNTVKVQPTIRSISLFELEDKKYDLILAFDVLEHLYNLDQCMANLQNKLKIGGLLFITVPNRHALWEKLFKWSYEKRRKQNLPLDTSGVSHVQFRNPEEWREFFCSYGFRVLEHDMGIGFLVNDLWHGIYGIPLRKIVIPIISKGSMIFGLNLEFSFVEQLFYPCWLMETVNMVDKGLKPKFGHRWGWNLFVLTK